MAIMPLRKKFLILGHQHPQVSNYLGDVLGNSFASYWTGGLVDSESVSGINVFTDAIKSQSPYYVSSEDLYYRENVFTKNTSPWEGSFLVRTDSGESKDVPEPITGLVLAAAGGGAALRRAKNKKQSKQS
jgi:hypothetical protein